MGAYPALAIQPPQNPIENYSRIIALKGMLQNQAAQQQMRPLEIQQQQTSLQQQQQALKDQQAITQSMLNWDGKNPSDLSHAILQNGGSGNAALGTAAHFLALRKDTAEAIKNEGQGALDAANAKKTQFDQAAGQFNSLLNLPDDQRPSAIVQTAQDWAKQGLVDPQHVQDAQRIAQLPPDQQKQQLALYAKGLTGLSAQIEQGQKEADAYKAQQEGKKAELENKAIQQFGGLTPDMQQSKYIALQQKKNEGQPLSGDDQAFVKAYERNKTLNTQFQFNLQNAGVGGQGGQPSAIAQAIANGSMKWTDVVSPRTPFAVKEQIANEVKQLNPTFNSGDFAVEQKVKEAFTSGNYSQQLNAINTARQHMQTFSTLADALNNGDVQALNKIGNELGVQFGSDKATNFKIAAQAFGGEVGKAFDGAGVTQAERESAANAFNPNMSPAQLKGAVRTVDALLQGKQNALKSTFQQGTQAKPNFGNPTPQQSSSGFQVGQKITLKNGKQVTVTAVHPDGTFDAN